MVVEIYCGENRTCVPGYQFYCYYPETNLLYHCIGRNDWQYQCWDGGEWEWNNYLEHDNTPDGSRLTSIVTDNIFATSASLDVRDAAQSETVSNDSVTSFADETDSEKSEDSWSEKFTPFNDVKSDSY